MMDRQKCDTSQQAGIHPQKEKPSRRGNPLPFYMYLDNELMDIAHLCCLAHARAKFKYAYDQGSLQARIFFELTAKSYSMEDTYRWEKLTADEIYIRKNNSKETTEIIDKIRTELYDLLANPDVRMVAEANL